MAGPGLGEHPELYGYKKDLALAARGITVKAESAFDLFSRSNMHRKADLDTDASLKQYQLPNLPLSKFIESFRRSVDQLKKVPPSGGLHDLTVVELHEMAKAKGVSLNMTKQDVIDCSTSWNPASITRRSKARP